MEQSEERLALEQLKLGVDMERAFACLVRMHKQRVYSHVLRLGATGAEAEDLTQRAFIEAWRRIASFDPARSKFSTWLIEIAKNMWFSLCRGHGREQACLRSMAICGPVSAKGPEELEVEKARRELVSEMLARLDFYERNVAAMCFMEGMSYREVGLVLHKSVSWVKKTSARARHLLRLQSVVRPLPEYTARDREVAWMR
jgi:RNA polymerase sigma-70 factor, ECF subfamily